MNRQGAKSQRNKIIDVMPVQAGIRSSFPCRTPACAGVTLKSKIFSYLLAFLVFFYCIPPAQAQATMTEIEPLSFGLFSLRNNDAQHNLTVFANGGPYNADPAFVVSSPEPQRGEYLLEGFDPGEEITVTIDPGGLAFEGAGADVFSVLNYTVEPDPVIADGSGAVTVYVGATLRTSGNGIIGDTGDYSGDLDITFDWLP